MKGDYNTKLYKYGMEGDIYGSYSIETANASKEKRRRRIERGQRRISKKKGSAWDALYKYFLEGMWD